MAACSLRDALEQVVRPVLEEHGFTKEEPAFVRGIHVFLRKRDDGLVESIVYGIGKNRNEFGVDLAIVREGQHPIDALSAMPRISESALRVGVRDSLGRIVHDDRYFPGRDVYRWETDDDLRRKVRETAELALSYGPSYWEAQASRLKKPGLLRSAPLRRKGVEDRRI